MKKILLCMLSVFMVFAVSACSSGVDFEPAIIVDEFEEVSDVVFDENEVNYIEAEVLYRPSKTADELIRSANLVVHGKVTGISFRVLDSTTSLPPTEKTEDMSRRLYTIYDIDVITSYKGDVSGTIQFRAYGGIEGYRVEEQLKLVNEMNAWPNGDIHWPNNAITLGGERPAIEIGETYLFTLREYGKDILPTLMMPQQSVYNIRNPFEKRTLRGGEFNDSSVGSRNEDRYGDPLISAKDIISAFGDEKWDSFWSEWQKDNPDWETRIDKTAVEDVLSR